MTKISSENQLYARIGGLASQVVERAPTKDKTAEILDELQTGEASHRPALTPLTTEYSKLQTAVQKHNAAVDDEVGHIDLDKVLGQLASKARRSVVSVELKKDGSIDGKKLSASVLSEMGRTVVGHEDVIELALMAQLLGGHILLEGPVGVGKTHLAKAFAGVAGLQFKRQQFVSDLLPGDVTGTEIPDPETRELKPHYGPIAESNIFLADEINRAPPTAQGALLESMGEGQLTVGRETRQLEEFFTVIATQNPDHHDGTYPLTEANRDRFAFKVVLGRPTEDQQMKIADLQLDGFPDLRQVVGIDELQAARKSIQDVRIEKPVRLFAIRLVRGTWPEHSEIDDVKGKIAGEGASERATGAIMQAARARAFLKGRDYTLPEDVAQVAPHVLRHRIQLKPSCKDSVDDIIDTIIEQTEEKMSHKPVKS